MGRLFNAAAALLGALALSLALALAPAASPAAAGPVRVLALGDSLTAGYGLPPEQGFTAALERALRERGIDARVINGGVSGDTTAGGLSRLDWSLADDPQVAIVALGANDGLRGIDPANTRANLDAILSKLRRKGIPVLLAGMYAPRNLGRDYAERFDRLYPELAEKHGVALYPFFLEGVAADPRLNQADGIHPNREGVAVMVKGILPHLEPLVRAAQG
jgi:acyl-CoA thioesterase-1